MTYLVVVQRITGTATPRANADVRLAVGEGSHEFLQLRVILDGGDPLDVTFVIQMHTVFQRRLGSGVRSVPCRVQVLHEVRVSFPSGGFSDLLDGHVAAGADDVADVDEVVAQVAVLGDLGLLAFEAIVEGDDGAGGLVRCGEDGGGAWLDGDVVVVVEAVDFERLVVTGLVVDVDVMHVVRLWAKKGGGNVLIACAFVCLFRLLLEGTRRFI